MTARTVKLSVVYPIEHFPGADLMVRRAVGCGEDGTGCGLDSREMEFTVPMDKAYEICKRIDRLATKVPGISAIYQ